MVASLHPFVFRGGQGAQAVVVAQQTGDPHRGEFLSFPQFELQTAVGAIAVAEDRFVGVGLLVGGDDPFVVAQHHLVRRPGDEIGRHHRNLAAAMGGIDDVGGDGESAGVPDEALHDLDPLADGGAEMGEPLREIALVHVIGTDAVLHELLHQ